MFNNVTPQTAENARQTDDAAAERAKRRLPGRTRERQDAKRFRAEMIAHVGGQPSATQRCLIDRVVQLRLHLAIMDRRFANEHTMPESSSKVYLAWCGALSRLLRQLGLHGAAPRAPTLAETLAQSPGAHARADAAARAGAPAPSSAAAPPARAVEAVRGTSPEAVAA